MWPHSPALWPASRQFNVSIGSIIIVTHCPVNRNHVSPGTNLTHRFGRAAPTAFSVVSVLIFKRPVLLTQPPTIDGFTDPHLKVGHRYVGDHLFDGRNRVLNRNWAADTR